MPEHLPALKAQADFSGAQAFNDSEALRALDAITRTRPAVVALDQVVAATTRGAALINRIKADPSLTACEIRIIEPGQVPVAAAAAPPPAPGGATLGPLDYRGTRRAPRFRINDGIEVTIDGNPAALVDLSVIGAMVISPTILRPNQRVRMALPDRERPIRFGAGIAWAAFELLKTGPRYRAGIEFFDADAAAVQKVIDANRKP